MIGGDKMNARQKAKYYKRKYEDVLSSVIKPTVIYESERLVPYKIKEIESFPDMYGDNFIRYKLARAMADKLVEHIANNMEMYEISSTLNVSGEDWKEVKGIFKMWGMKNGISY